MLPTRVDFFRIHKAAYHQQLRLNLDTKSHKYIIKWLYNIFITLLCNLVRARCIKVPQLSLHLCSLAPLRYVFYYVF